MNASEALDPIRSLKAVGRVARRTPGPLLAWWFGGLAAMFAVYFAVYLPSVLVLVGSSGRTGRPEPWAIALFACGVLVLVVVLVVGQCYWRIGLAHLLADALRTGTCTVSSGLRVRGRLLPMIGSQLLIGAIVLVTYLPMVAVFVAIGALSRHGDTRAVLLVLAVLLGFVWFGFVVWLALGFVFVPHAIALDGAGPVEALRRSWGLARGRRLALIGFLLVAALCALAGFLLCCIGYLATAALVELMPMEAYLALTRGDEYAGWWVETGRVPETGTEAVPAAEPPLPGF